MKVVLHYFITSLNVFWLKGLGKYRVAPESKLPDLVVKQVAPGKSVSFSSVQNIRCCKFSSSTRPFKDNLIF